jgi:hypothetical protein
MLDHEKLHVRSRVARPRSAALSSTYCSYKPWALDRERSGVTYGLLMLNGNEDAHEDEDERSESLSG